MIPAMKRSRRQPLLWFAFLQLFCFESSDCRGQQPDPISAGADDSANWERAFHRFTPDGYLILLFTPREKNKWKLTVFPGRVELWVSYRRSDAGTYHFKILDDANTDNGLRRIVETLISKQIEFEIRGTEKPGSDSKQIVSISDDEWIRMLSKTAEQNKASHSSPDRSESKLLF